MLVKVDGSTTETSKEQYLNAPEPREATLNGITTEVSEEQD